MARVKGGPVTHLRHNKGNFGTRSRLFRRANETMLKSMWYATRDRKNRKRDLRRLWIVRINAGARAHGLSYSKFVFGMRKADIQLNRKILADLAIRNPEAFTSVIEKAKAAL